MKRRRTRLELEQQLAEIERVLAWVAGLDEGSTGAAARGKALGEVGAAAREALARLSMAEPMTGAGQPAARELPAGMVCDHAKHRPDFDSASACGLEADEIANRWPPFEGLCSCCGAWVLLYASPTHEVLARW